MDRKTILATAAIITLVGMGAYSALNRHLLPSSPEITIFEACAGAGYPVEASLPWQCRTLKGKNFVETLTESPQPAPGRVTISGKITCLPKRGSGAQTMECAIGLKGSDGWHLTKDLTKSNSVLWYGF